MTDTTVKELKDLMDEINSSWDSYSLGNYDKAKSAYDRIVCLLNKFQSDCRNNGIEAKEAKRLDCYPVYKKGIDVANELEKLVEYLQTLKLYIKKSKNRSVI